MPTDQWMVEIVKSQGEHIETAIGAMCLVC